MQGDTAANQGQTGVQPVQLATVLHCECQQGQAQGLQSTPGSCVAAAGLCSAQGQPWDQGLTSLILNRPRRSAWKLKRPEHAPALQCYPADTAGCFLQEAALLKETQLGSQEMLANPSHNSSFSAASGKQPTPFHLLCCLPVQNPALGSNPEAPICPLLASPAVLCLGTLWCCHEVLLGNLNGM